MPPIDSDQQSQAQFIDWFFSDPGPRFDYSATAVGTPAAVRPESPPEIKDAAGINAAQVWLKAERARLEAYTRNQFDVIRQQHQTLLAKHFHSEETLTLRCQEVNREMQFVASQSEALQKKAQELALRERILASQMERLSKAQQELLTIQQTSEDVRRDTEAQREVLEQLRAETSQLQQVESAARLEFVAFDTELRERKRAWEMKQTEITARQAQMEQRYQALEKAEAAAQRRLAELDELEERLYEEIGEQRCGKGRPPARLKFV
jgi:hypothetical protein